MNQTPFVQNLTPAALDRARQSVRGFNAPASALTIAWVSDIHLHAPRAYSNGLNHAYVTAIDCSANLRLALAEIGALTPRSDVVMFGGDLADSGCGGEAPSDEYDELRRVFATDLPANWATLPMLGNHDHADQALTPAWHIAWERTRRPEWPAPVEAVDYYYVTRVGGWRFIVLDSRQGHPLSDRQREWLGGQLTQDATTPTVVFVHRPFLAVGNWVDSGALNDRRSFDLIDQCPAVRAVVSGHTHKSAHWEYRGKRHIIFPACAYGLPDPCGWGVVRLGATTVESVFVKELAAATYDGVACRLRTSPGAFRELPAQSYIASPLCHPGLFPHPFSQ